MVQFLPPTTKGRLNEESGKAFSSGIGEVLDEAREYKRNRGRLQDALKSIESISPEDRRNPTKLLTSLLSATAGIPGAERYTGQLFEQLLKFSERGRSEEDFGGMPPPGGGQPPIGGGQPTQGQPVQQQQQQQQQQENVLQFAPPSYQTPGQIADPNLKTAQVPKTYSPEDILGIRQKARRLNYSPQMEDALVGQAQEYNENARKQIGDLQSGYALQQQLRNDTLKNQQAFKEYIETETPEFASPDEKQLALEYGDKYQNEPSMAKRLARVKQDLRPYQQAKSALDTALKRPLFGQTQNQRELARRNAKMMVEKGQKDQLRLMIAKGGHGDIEEADLLNPLPQKIENDLKTIPKLKNLDEMISVTAESPKFEEQRQQAEVKRREQAAATGQRLEQYIQPGTYANPGTNLLLLRKGLMDRGFSWDEAGLAIQDAIQRKKIQLDPHQQIDIQKLGYPPLAGDAYTDNIVQYYLFGKE